MAAPTVTTNGHQPVADGGHGPHHEHPHTLTMSRDDRDKVQVMVKPATHQLVRQVATRLGRSNDAVIRRALYMLDKATQSERKLKDDDWAEEGAQ